jgi:hypothetical protein
MSHSNDQHSPVFASTVPPAATTATTGSYSPAWLPSAILGGFNGFHRWWGGTFVGRFTLALTEKKGSAKSHLDLLDLDVTSYAINI